MNEPSVQMRLHIRNPDTGKITPASFTVDMDKFRILLNGTKSAVVQISLTLILSFDFLICLKSDETWNFWWHYIPNLFYRMMASVSTKLVKCHGIKGIYWIVKPLGLKLGGCCYFLPVQSFNFSHDILSVNDRAPINYTS